MDKNNAIRCDVQKCTHNCNGQNCCLDSIKVTCGCNALTCCDDFMEKE